jgi:hypothetical protein
MSFAVLNSTYKHIRHIWDCFWLLYLEFFVKWKPSQLLFLYFFRIEFLLHPSEIDCISSYYSKSEKTSRIFVTASQQTVLALMSIFHIPILVDAAALT